jgi:hypothetical protein
MLERRRESYNFGRMKRVYRPSGERDYEITPEVIRAGRRELTDDVARDLYDGFLNPEDVAVSVYRAMLQAHEKSIQITSAGIHQFNYLTHSLRRACFRRDAIFLYRFPSYRHSRRHVHGP